MPSLVDGGGTQRVTLTTETVTAGRFSLATAGDSGWTAEQLLGFVAHLGSPRRGGRRAKGARIRICCADDEDTEIAVDVYAVSRATGAAGNELDEFTLTPLGTLTATLGASTFAGTAALESAVRTGELVADTMVWAGGAYATAIVNAGGAAIAAYSPADDTEAELIIPDALNAWGLLLVSDTAGTIAIVEPI